VSAETAETLREAARQMREQHGPQHERHEMWSRMADLLDTVPDTGTSSITYHAALKVARAYLGVAS
jgi:hypothetical protein